MNNLSAESKPPSPPLRRAGNLRSATGFSLLGTTMSTASTPTTSCPRDIESGPGKAVTALDEQECAGRFEAFFHAPFRDDCAAPRNETSLAMQVTLTSDSGIDGKVLLLGILHTTPS